MWCFAATGYAAPADGVVAAGSANITRGGSRTTITQSSAQVAINWQSFGIAAGEAVQFIQPSSNSVALNRVLGPNPSSIFGTLSANGKVFLLNPNGILFGSGSNVNVGGLVASTLSMSDANFMARQYKFGTPGAGAIVNQGTIQADGGYVALLGTNVSNQGVISARLGTVVLAAGNAITLDMAGDSLLNVRVDEGAVNALVENGGLIRADGGMVLLTTQAAGNLVSTAVNNTGVIQAQTLQNHNGTIKLLGDMQTGTVNLGGTLDASGTLAGQTGGSVTVTGRHVGLFGGNIDASGDAGGGSVLIGGGYQGKNSAVQNASATYMSADSTITADAITQGSGGTVVLWADGSTRAYGSIAARGGARGGDGGLIETSGNWLDVVGIKINASAPNGKHGLWLLDPADITIGAGTTNATRIGNVFSPNSGVNVATVDAGALAAALGVGGAGTDITITTTNSGAPGTAAGNINVNAAVSWSPTTSTTLTLLAAGDVNINAPITATGGNLVVCCGRDINVNARVTTTNGSVLLSAGRDVNITRTALTPLAGITTTDGNIAMCARRDVILNNAADGAPLITLTTGSVTAGQDLANLGVPRGLTLNAGNAGTGPGAAGGTVVISAGTILTVTGPAGISPINIFYNPTTYLTPTDYSGFFATGNGAPLSQFMLVFPDGANKTFDGTTTAAFTGLKGAPAGVTLAGAGTANFDTAAEGLGKTVSFTGFSLAGLNANAFAFATPCCGPLPAAGRTTANITAAPLPVPVVPLPAPVVPLPVPVVPLPVPIVPLPVPVVLVPPPVVLVPELARAGPGGADFVTSQFAPFVVAPLLLQPPSALLVVSSAVPPPVTLVVVQAEAAPVAIQAPPPATPVLTPIAPPVAAPPIAAPAVPRAPPTPPVAPVRPPKAYRN